jgi:hypothetical protein
VPGSTIIATNILSTALWITCLPAFLAWEHLFYHIVGFKHEYLGLYGDFHTYLWVGIGDLWELRKGLEKAIELILEVGLKILEAGLTILEAGFTIFKALTCVGQGQMANNHPPPYSVSI